MLKILIDDHGQLKQAARLFRTGIKTAVVKGLKAGFRRSLKKMQTEADRAVRARVVRLKASDIKKRWFRPKLNLTGNDPGRFSATLGIAQKPIPMILLVRGSRMPRKQKGLSVKQRRPVRAEIRPGRVKAIKGAFIAKGRNRAGESTGQYQVFKRLSKGRLPIMRQSLPSIHHEMRKVTFKGPFMRKIKAFHSKETTRVITVFVNQAIDRVL